jgi:NAD(P)H-hydrate epimerase
MDISEFNPKELKKLYRPDKNSSGEDNGQITIIGGSRLFHGAPILSLKVASRIVDMVFFASPFKPLKSVVSKLKASLSSFIWIPWDEVDHYIEKSDAVLIGPGLMRFSHESQVSSHELLSNDDEVAKETRNITKRLLAKFPHKRWVIDAGSLQTMDAQWIPENAIVTPNIKEFEMLFGESVTEGNRVDLAENYANKYKCVVVLKGPETVVASRDETVIVKGGNPGLTKGGTGDVLAGLTVGLLAKNDPYLSAAAASFIEKYAADKLYDQMGTNYNADDLADKIPGVTNHLVSKTS